MAKSLEQEGFEVVGRFASGGRPPDIIHAQHEPALVAALQRYPDTPAIQVVHDATAPFDVPLVMSRVAHYASVDKRCEQRLIGAGVHSDRCEMILNFADLDRFARRGPLATVPKRALVFSNYPKTAAENDAIVSACAVRGIDVDFLGSSTGTGSVNPEQILPTYDIVFAKARAAIEAMAVGCAVVLCDFRGLGRLVSPDNFDDFRPWNFGAALLTNPITAEAVEAELARYDPGSAARVTTRIRDEAGLEFAAEQWLDLYRRVIQQGPRPTQPDEARRLRERSRVWHLPVWAARLRVRTRSMRQSKGLSHSLYRGGRSLWRLLGEPGRISFP